MNKTYDRRQLFKAFGGSALLLHPLLSMRDVSAQNAVKKRFLVSMTSSGVVQNSFWPKGNSAQYNLSGTALEPLTTFIPDLNIIQGVKNDHGPFDSHDGGAVSLLTGNLQNSCGLACDAKGFALNASIDQLMAARYKSQTSLPSLQLAIIPTEERMARYISFNSAGQALPQSTDPYTIFNAVFRDLTQNCRTKISGAEDLLFKRKSILDALKGDLQDASKSTGLTAEEKVKLEGYMESIRQIEKSMVGLQSTSKKTCSSLDQFADQAPIPITAENYPKVARLMLDLIASAFELDVTRVATVVWSIGGAAGVPSTWAQFNGMPIPEAYHALTHMQVDPINWEAKLKILDRYHAGEFAYLLGKLKAIDEGGSSLLDNSLALWTSEIGQGSDHSQNNTPFILAGRAGGAVKTGRFLQFPSPDTSHHRLLISLLQAMGLGEVQSIGNSGNGVNGLL